jgi:dihydrofolate reductase
VGRIVISENVTLDGVIEDPTGEEGFGLGGWFGRMSEEDRAAWTRYESDEAMSAEALLLGRRTHEFFAARWPSRSGEWADRLNSLPKYVVSSTVEALGWNNSTILRGDVVEEVTTLKERLGGDIVVYASGHLVHTLLEKELADELRLMICPFVLGAGRRLFEEVDDARRVRLVQARTVGEGLALLTYQPVGVD